MDRYTQTRTDATTMTPEALHEVYRLCGLDPASWDQVCSLKIRAGVVRVIRFRKPEYDAALIAGGHVCTDTVEIMVRSDDDQAQHERLGMHQVVVNQTCPGCGSVTLNSHTASCQLGKTR